MTTRMAGATACHALRHGESWDSIFLSAVMTASLMQMSGSTPYPRQSSAVS